MNGQPKFPPPPGAGGVPAQTAIVDPPKVQVEKKSGFLGNVYSKVRSVAVTVYHKVASVVAVAAACTIILFSYPVRGLRWVYTHAMCPVFAWIERWVPFAGELRYAMKLWIMLTALVCFVLGIMIGIEVGAGFFTTIGLGFYAALIVLPWVILTNPSIWINIAFDLIIISGFTVVAYAFVDWICFDKPFWASLAHRVWPGGYEHFTKRHTTIEVAEEALNHATA